jgi:YaaC-like Protein
VRLALTQPGDFTVAISGPGESVEDVIRTLNAADFFAHRIRPLDRVQSGEVNLTWIEVIAESGEPVPSSDFQSRVLEVVGEIAQKYGFKSRSHAVPLVGGEKRYLPYRVIHPIVHPGALIITERPNADIYWDQLRKVASGLEVRVPNYVDSGSHVVSGSVVREFSSYIRQAEDYYRAAEVTRGTSAALLLYYSLLNLAKAEILLWRPEIFPSNGRIHHGLTAVTGADNLEEWKVKVQSRGVFPLLYEKRIGSPMENLPYEIGASGLFSRCLESSVEYEQAAFGPVNTSPFYHVIVTDGVRSWSQLLVDNYGAVLSSESTRDLIRDYFEEVPISYTRDLWQTFSISPRRALHQSQLLSAKRAKDVSTGSDGFMVADLRMPHWVMEIRERFRPVMGFPTEGYDGVITASLVSDRIVGLTPDLARYAAVFLVSDLVRYRPGTLDRQYFPLQAWYLESFVRQAMVPALESAASKLLGRELLLTEINRL